MMSGNLSSSASNMNDRLRVVVTIDTKATGWELLAPVENEGNDIKVGRCDFILNPSCPVDADYWIVFANARAYDEVRCAPENTLFIAGEPEEKKVYPKAYYAQFYRIIDTHLRSGHPRVVLSAPCLSWHIGYDHARSNFDFGYKVLSAMGRPSEIENKVSVVCSNAAFTPGQRERLKFLEVLKEKLGEQIVHFGRGFRPVDDKLDAIKGYRFHLVMENCRVPHYWTEKISDAYLGWAFPLYVGSPNLIEYFPENTFVALDIKSPERAAEQIEALLATSCDEKEKEAVNDGRGLVLNRYNPWVAWARWAEQFHDPLAKPRKTIIRSHKAFRPFPRGLFFRFKNR
jgi:hypothetical protein